MAIEMTLKEALATQPLWYMQNLEYIIWKSNDERDGKNVLFKLNEPQKKLLREVERQRAEGRPVRIVILKARQMGISTFTEGYGFQQTMTHKNFNFGIVTQSDKATKNLFEMSKHFYEFIPDTNQNSDEEANEPDEKRVITGEMLKSKGISCKPEIKNSNSFELLFRSEGGKGLNSSIRCFTANDDVGRSNKFSFLHLSEFAFWNCDKVKALGSILSCVPKNKNTTVIIESTANGYDEFKDLWDNAVSGNSDFVPLFFSWFELPTNRLRYDGHVLDIEEQELKRKYNLDNDQLQWRLYTLKNDCSNNLALFKQENPSCPDEAFINTGNCAFDLPTLVKRQSEVIDPISRGRFSYKYDGLKISDIKWVEDDKGFIKIYEQPISRYPYVIGGDTAGDGSDNFVGQVLDNTNGRQVAKLLHKTDEDLYVRQMYCLGMYYNKALLGVEINFSTYPNKELQRLKYPKMYVREREDTYTKNLVQSFGFRTTVANREGIISTLIAIVRETPELILDKDTLVEMTNVIRDESYKACAMKGKHDDCTMALAIAHAIRNQQDFKPSYDKPYAEMNRLERLMNKSLRERRNQSRWE